ncbi:MAG: hypothetical protein ACTIAA_11240 [Microbacterium sp.]|nr:hypothetical protein EB836_06530 [Brevibacterium sp. S111]
MVAEAVHQHDTAEVEKLRDESRKKAKKQRWIRPSHGNGGPADGDSKTQPSAYPNDNTDVRAGAHIVNEFIIGLIEHKIAIDKGDKQSVDSVDLSDTELATVQQLSETIAGKVLSDIEGHLRSGGPQGRKNKRADHFFCVVLAAVCQVYATLNDCASKTNEELAEIIVGLIELSVKNPKDDSPEPYPRTVEKPKGRGKKRLNRDRDDSFTLLDGERDFLQQVILKLLEAARKSAMAPIEKGVMLHLRVIAAITCPDPDRHPSIIKYCIWPLLKGPLRELISEEVAGQMETWLVETYPKEGLS